MNLNTIDLDTELGMRVAVQWTTQTINRLNEGGTWIVPRSGTLIKIEHSKKTATFLTSLIPEPSIERVFGVMGWKVKHD